MAVKRLLLLGAGPAHVAALLQWTREGLGMADVTLVAPLEKQAFADMVPGHLAGHFPAEALMLPVAELAQAAKVRWVAGTAAKVDADQRSVVLADGRLLGFDVLSIDAGFGQDRGFIPGAREHALWVHPSESFLNFALQMFEIARERELDVVVIGGGPHGVEMALAIQCRFEAMRPTHGRSRVTLLAGVSGVLPGAAQAVRRLAAQALARAKVVVVNEDARAVSSDHVHLQQGARLACDAPIICTGVQPAGWLQHSGLALNDAGFVATHPSLQSVSHPNVFAVNDRVFSVDATQERAEAFGARVGTPLAANLRAQVAGGALVGEVKPPNGLSFLTLGRRSAVVNWGPYALSGAWVWWWKRRLDQAVVRACRDGLKPAKASA
jgi:NADH dehydrogenase FAD-containing subunit